jgi:hypothetical protein
VSLESNSQYLRSTGLTLSFSTTSLRRRCCEPNILSFPREDYGDVNRGCEEQSIGHREFDLKLTDRVKMRMVGVPEASFDFWAAKVKCPLFPYWTSEALTALSKVPRARLQSGQSRPVRDCSRSRTTVERR